MEKYEWFCPNCGAYNVKYISEYNSKPCKNCNRIYILNPEGKTVDVCCRF